MKPKFLNLTTVGKVRIILNINHIIFVREQPDKKQIMILTTEKEYITVKIGLDEFKDLIDGLSPDLKVSSM